jgi:Uma2 family endonuclease
MLREQLYTVDEFLEVTRLPENADRRLELEDGVIVEVAASTRLNTVTAGRLVYFLNAFVIPRDLGYVTTPDAGYKLGKRRYRQPDVAFIAKARAGALRGVEFDVAPDLAIEVVSENEDSLKKAFDYLLAGTQLVWAVYAQDRLIHVIHLDDDGGMRSQPYRINDVLDGGAVLPGFTLAVKDVFPE